MNEQVDIAAHHWPQGALTGILNSAWRRSAEQIALDERVGADAVKQCAARPSCAVWALSFVPLLIAAGASAVVAVAACSQAPHDEASSTEQRKAATQAFLDQRYATAYGRFAQLADEGDASASLMALAMVCQGPSLFGSAWSATPGQLRRWGAMAIDEVDARATLIAEHDRGE